MKRFAVIAFLAFILSGILSCEILDNDPEKHVEKQDSTYVGLEEVAEILALIPMQLSQLNEVHNAVTSSSGNGYDEEYTMKDLFGNPGSGVGDHIVRSADDYPVPLRDLIEDYVNERSQTRSISGRTFEPEAFLNALMSSDIQIYWPYSSEWDKEKYPIITFDPEDGSEKNVGYRLVVKDDGSRSVEEVIVDEEAARTEPVWVVNRNTDAGYTTLEMLRRENPDWGEGGGTIIVRPKSLGSQRQTRSGKSSAALILKDFTMHRNYDSWFAGASEFFVLTITGGCSFA